MHILGAIAIKSRGQTCLFAKLSENLVLLPATESSKQDRHRYFARAVDPRPDHVISIGLHFQPSTAIGDKGRGVNLVPQVVESVMVVCSGGAHQLADHNTLRTIIDNGAILSHERKISHEDFLFLDLASLFIHQSHFDPERCRISRILLLGLIDSVLGFTKLMLEKLKHQVAGEILNRGNVPKRFR